MDCGIYATAMMICQALTQQFVSSAHHRRAITVPHVLSKVNCASSHSDRTPDTHYPRYPLNLPLQTPCELEEDATAYSVVCARGNFT